LIIRGRRDAVSKVWNDEAIGPKGDIAEEICSMLDGFVPAPESCSDHFRRLIPDVAFALMPDDVVPPRRLIRDEPSLTDIFNEIGENISHILKDDRTPDKVRVAIIDFAVRMDVQSQVADAMRYRFYHAQMMLPLALDILNDEDGEDEESATDAELSAAAVM
jgi:hypothetical protein